MKNAALTVLTLLLTYSYVTMAEVNWENEVMEANSVFTNNMYKSLSKKPGNVLFSPFSAHSCLTMASQAAAHNTREAFANTLQISDLSGAAHGYNSIMNKLNNAENVTLEVANKVYVMDKYHLKSNFKNIATNDFQSEIESINFAQGEAAAQVVNSWVKEKTKNKIEKLFEPGDLDSDTRVVLVNAIYFKGNWDQQFHKNDTKTEPFYLDDDNKVDVQMMHVEKSFYYKEDKELDAKVLQLFYINKQFSMVIVLPNEKDGITELENKLNDYDLTKVSEGLELHAVKVALPKFKIETEIELEETLTDMGLGIIFTDQCEFPELIEEPEQLEVDKAIQKAYLEVNEEGSEASGATAVEFTWRSTRILWNYFKANHPFIFMIVATQSDKENILFYGSVRDPNHIL